MAAQMCQMVLLGVLTGLGFQEYFVYITCPKRLGKHIFGKLEWMVVPLLTSGASAPWCPFHASAGMFHIPSFQ